MKVFLIIWITLVLLPFGLYSQGDILNSGEIDYNYNQYRKTFQEELNALETSEMEARPFNGVGLSSVPAWLMMPLACSSSTITVIGISDPGIDSAIARSQAIFRALFLASLMSSSSLSNLVDKYSQDFENKASEFSGRYIDYFEFISQVSCEISEAKVLKEQFTDFGECIVQIEYQVNTGSKPALIFKTVGMINEFEKDGIYEGNSRIEFSGQSQANSMADYFKYISRSVNSLVDVESYHQDELLTVYTAKLKYRLPDSTDQSIKTEGARTDRGLWNALLTSVIRIVTIELRTQSGQVKSASDHYTGKSQTLDREAITGNLSFRLNQILIHDNNLWAILDQFNFSQP